MIVTIACACGATSRLAVACSCRLHSHGGTGSLSPQRPRGAARAASSSRASSGSELCALKGHRPGSGETRDEFAGRRRLKRCPASLRLTAEALDTLDRLPPFANRRPPWEDSEA